MARWWAGTRWRRPDDRARDGPAARLLRGTLALTLAIMLTLTLTRYDLIQQLDCWAAASPSPSPSPSPQTITLTPTLPRYDLIQQLVCSAARSVHGNGGLDFVHGVCQWRRSAVFHQASRPSTHSDVCSHLWS